MAIIATAGEGKSFIPAPAGLHPAVCVDIVDLGIVKTQWGTEPPKSKHMARIVWQLEDEGERFLAVKRYNISLHEKATLRKDLESWRGKPFSEDELKGFDLEKLLGVNCQINIQHATKDGTTYANVISIVPLGRGMAKLAQTAYVRVKDRTDAARDDDGPITADDVPF